MTNSPCSPDTAEVRFGFASYKGGKFELIATNIRTGKEVTLEGQLRPDQSLEHIDKVLPTCAYVNGTSETWQGVTDDLVAIWERTIAMQSLHNLVVTRSFAAETLAALRARHAAAGSKDDWAIFKQAMVMLEDVPGGTLLERIARLKEAGK